MANRVRPANEEQSVDVQLSSAAFRVPGVYVPNAAPFTAGRQQNQRRVFIRPDLFVLNQQGSEDDGDVFSVKSGRTGSFMSLSSLSGHKKKGMVDNMYNFNDIVDLDDEGLEDFVSNDLLGRLLDGVAFRIAILLIIIANSVLIGVQTNATLEKTYSSIFSAFDKIFLTIFIVEILVKWYYGFITFWKVGWNVFDFAIVAASVLGPSVQFLSSGRVLRILRVLRAFRTLRSIS
eukprot:Colp12_sorted_trinity150504_noHs@16679